MIEVETQTIEVEVVTNTEVTSTGQVEVETVDLSDLDITVAKKEYVITGDDIYIPMLYDDAPQWMKNLVQVVVDVSISSGNQSLINDMNAIIQDFAVSYVPLNQYTQSIIDLSDEDTRLNGLIETLNSNFNDGLSTANAQIISLQLTKASKDEVVAQVIQTIAAQLADGTSNIGSIIGRIDQAIANETSARALSLQTLTASLEDTNLDVTANAEVIQNALAYVGIDEAGASTGTGLSAYLEDSNGNIGGADSELANSIRVTAEGVESKFAYNSLLNINGVYKKSGFGLTTNYTSGNGTQANPYVSEFWIDASRFKFTNSNATGSVTPFSIDATGASPEIYFNGKVNFSNVVGAGGQYVNLIKNSEFQNSVNPWGVGWNPNGSILDHFNISENVHSSDWIIKGSTGSLTIHQANRNTSTANDDTAVDLYPTYAYNSEKGFSVTPGQTYEFSIYASAHRCDIQLIIQFFDINLNYISGTSTGRVSVSSGGNYIEAYTRVHTRMIAPANARTALLVYRKHNTNAGSTDSWIWIARPFFGMVSANSSAPVDYVSSDSVESLYTPGTTTIRGDVITTGSIGASQIASYNITAVNTTFGNSIIGNAQIVDGSITNGKIANASIDNAKIADASITNAKISDLSVSTFKIQDEAIVVPRFASGIGSCTIVYTPSVSHNVLISVYGGSLNGATYAGRRLFLNGVLQLNKSQAYYADGSGFYYNQFSFYLWAGNTYTFTYENASSTVNGDGVETSVNLEAKMTMLGVKK